jgi:hypothetical protein
MVRVIPYDGLSDTDLTIDAVYEGAAGAVTFPENHYRDCCRGLAIWAAFERLDAAKIRNSSCFTRMAKTENGQTYLISTPVNSYTTATTKPLGTNFTTQDRVEIAF